MDNDENAKEDTFLLKKNFTLRNYQLKLLEIARKQNTIIFLPTGAGKTLIAVHVLYSRTKEIKGLFSNGSKRAFFVSSTKIMVFQIAEVISAHTKFKVGFYTGDMHIDSWSKEMWLDEFEKNEVLVLTAEILRQLLQMNYIEIKQISLLVFDECHHAVSEHPYRVIMLTIAEANEPESPLILGLSAILLNSNPKRGTAKTLIRSLESTYKAKVFTEVELEDVLKMSANPKEKLVIYEPYIFPSYLEQIVRIYKQATIAFDNINLKPSNCPYIPEGGIDYRERNAARRLRKVFVLASECLQQFGPFCGSLAALYYVIFVEKRRLMETDQKAIQVLIYARTQLNKIRRLLIKEMGEKESLSVIYKYSSFKVQQLINLLKGCYMSAKGKHVSTIVFVSRKVAAIVLSAMLKRLSQVSEELSAIRAEFVIGSSIYTKEFTFLECGNEDIVKQFSTRELNLLVATNVLEEGVDVSDCNIVISFDFPLAYPSYIQSRGRARDKNSTYYLFVEKSTITDSSETLENYKLLHEELHEVVRQNVNDEASEIDVKDGREKFYFTVGGKTTHIDGATAIKVVHRYCGGLPQDRFCCLGPTCWYEKKENKKQGFLRLPTSSPLRELVKGDLKINCKLAKESVFLETVKLLKRMGELDDDLSPKTYEMNEKKYEYLFPHFKSDDNNPKLPMAGTKKRLRTYNLIFPDCLCDCFPQPGKKSYLHVFALSMSCGRPTFFRDRAMYDFLNDPCTYGIISTKRIPKLCSFPLFMDNLQVYCDFLANYKEIVLTESEIEDIKSFHFSLFTKVLYIAKSAHVWDNKKNEKSYLIVPLDKTKNNGYSINWDLIRSDFCKQNVSAVVRFNPSFEFDGERNPFADKVDSSIQRTNLPENNTQSMTVMPFSGQESELLSSLKENEKKRKPNFIPTEADYKYFVISPSYRYQDPPLFYIVVKICSDMTPMSKFPKADFDDFYSYYKEKYGIVITNPEQPLLHVAPINNLSNYNKPKIEKPKRKTKEKCFEEHFIPELCHIYPFLNKYWVKANLVPSLLNRMTVLLIADDFRRELTEALHLDYVHLPEDMTWKPLDAWTNFLSNKRESADEGELIADITSHSRFPLSKLKLHIRPKTGDTIPDPERHLHDVGLCDLEFYVNCLKTICDEAEECKLFKMNEETEEMIFENSNIKVPPLRLIDSRQKKSWVELARLMQALTARSAVDFFDCERLEILGDCFLKFSVSLYLYKTFDDNEGFLTSLKQKIVGNRNLLYCAWSRNLQKVVNTQEFEPRSDWSPPLFCIPSKFRETVLARNVDPAILYRLVFPIEEQFCGVLSEETYKKYDGIFELYEGACDENTARQILGIRIVKDKAISDCVEALLGFFLEDLGLNKAFDLLTYFEVLPKESSLETLVNMPNEFTTLEPNCEDKVLEMLSEVIYTDLENTLGYTFKNKQILLEALTHPSYSRNRLTHCYQRLEFLGDAILDFILTCFIYENYSDLSPGQITDLRSALVNNITFACLVVRYEIYKYMLSFSSPLNAAIESFVAFQADRKHVVDENVMILLEENDCLMSEAVQVPKPLGDLFESLAAAIYLDSGNSLQAVWNVYYKLMRKELEEFPKKVPKTSSRLLMEICHDYPYYEISVMDKKVKASCTVHYNCNEIQTHGFGANSKEAKKSAAKHALKKIMEMSK